MHKASSLSAETHPKYVLFRDFALNKAFKELAFTSWSVAHFEELALVKTLQ